MGSAPDPLLAHLPQSGTDLLGRAVGRSTALPWNASDPGSSVSRALPYSEGWLRVSANPTTLPRTLPGNAPAAERLLSLSFYAYARPGQAVGLILDPFHAFRPHQQAPRLLHWTILHPDTRRTLLARAFTSAIVAPSPLALVHGVRERAAHDPDPDVRAIWRARASTSLVPDLLADDALPPDVLDESERDILRTMAALGAFA